MSAGLLAVDRDLGVVLGAGFGAGLATDLDAGLALDGELFLDADLFCTLDFNFFLDLTVKNTKGIHLTCFTF